MSNYATLEQFKTASQKRLQETTEVDIPGVGKAVIGRLTGRQAASVKNAQQARILALQAGKTPASKFDVEIEYIIQGFRHPSFSSDEDRQTLANLDAGLLEYMATAVAEFNDLEAAEDKVKN